MASPQPKPDYVETLKKERDRFVALAFCAADVLFEVDENHRITYAAGATKALTELEPSEVVGQKFIDLIEPSERTQVMNSLDSLGDANRLEPMILRLKGPAGPTPPLMLTGYHLPDLPGSYFFALRLTGKEETVGEVQDPNIDPETGLLTKDAFVEAAAQRIKETGGDLSELKMTMLRLNDMGELRARLDAEADRDLMRTLGAAMSGGGNETAGCFDEENYGVLHGEDFDLPALKQRLEGHVRAADPTGIGIEVNSSTVPANIATTNPEDAVKALVYTINQYCDDPSSTPTIKSLAENLDDLVKAASTKMTEFRRIVSEEHFDMVFQPIVHVSNSQIHHYEVLARFAGGLDRSPYELITFAENMGLICDFDFAMVRKVIGQLQKWKRKKKYYQLAVNVSGRSIGNPQFLDALMKLLSENRDLSGQLLIEITESARIHNLERVNEVIQSLRGTGHKVCLDDFGAGAAALKYLHALDVDIVKVDGAYIRGAGDDRKLGAFLKAIAGLCNELDIETIAEMVEDHKTVALLRDCRIPFAQGYLFGRPSPDIASFDEKAKGKTAKRGGWSRISRAGA